VTLCITCQRAAYLCSCASCELLGWILKMASCVTVPVRTTGPNRRARVRGAYTEKIPARRGLGWCEPGPRPVCSGIGAERVQSIRSQQRRRRRRLHAAPALPLLAPPPLCIAGSVGVG
jgi:hypothetical protein